MAVEVPSLRDLYEYVTPQYAAQWKELGVLLGIPLGEVQAIEGGYPTNVKWCCNKMLEKWFETNTSATWEHLIAAIDSRAISARSGDAADEGT